MTTPITITPSLIAYVVMCEEYGIDIEGYITNLSFLKDILSITKDSGNPSKAYDLTLAENLWYKLIITNFLPRDQNMHLLSMDDKHLMHFFISRVRANIHLTIFKYMK